jgi:hypothetical protein
LNCRTAANPTPTALSAVEHGSLIFLVYTYRAHHAAVIGEAFE